MQELLNSIPQVGQVIWIGVRPERRAALTPARQVELTKEAGVVGDHFSGPAAAKRQVTLIQAEHLVAVASMLDRHEIDPSIVRRNIVVRGINLLALRQQSFQIGGAVLEGTGNCPPCSRMEENLGPGGYNAMRGHGGITARVAEPGSICIGDRVQLWLPDSADPIGAP